MSSSNGKPGSSNKKGPGDTSKKADDEVNLIARLTVEKYDRGGVNETEWRAVRLAKGASVDVYENAAKQGCDERNCELLASAAFAATFQQEKLRIEQEKQPAPRVSSYKDAINKARASTVSSHRNNTARGRQPRESSHSPAAVAQDTQSKSTSKIVLYYSSSGKNWRN